MRRMLRSYPLLELDRISRDKLDEEACEEVRAILVESILTIFAKEKEKRMRGRSAGQRPNARTS